MSKKVDLMDLTKKLPPLISREHIERFLGGIISPKTLGLPVERWPGGEAVKVSLR